MGLFLITGRLIWGSPHPALFRLKPSKVTTPPEQRRQGRQKKDEASGGLRKGMCHHHRLFPGRAVFLKAQTGPWGPKAVSSSRTAPSTVRPGNKRAVRGWVEPRDEQE